MIHCTVPQPVSNNEIKAQMVIPGEQFVPIYGHIVVKLDNPVDGWANFRAMPKVAGHRFVGKVLVRVHHRYLKQRLLEQSRRDQVLAMQLMAFQFREHYPEAPVIVHSLV